MKDKVTKTPEEWRQQLQPQAFNVLREQGTERAFTGEYWDCHTPGVYCCAGCGAPLFEATSKFDSGSGWPSFYQPVAAGAVQETTDQTHGMQRTELQCSRCDGHLGHVFADGPRPTGLRYCINSASLHLVPSEPRHKP